MGNQELSFVELNQSKVTDDVIQQFDCGNEDMTEYLHKYAKNDSIEGKGVTYVLVAEDRKHIYVYATIKAYSLYYYDEAEKYHTKVMNDDGKILLSIPAVAYLLDPVKKQHYSSIFFKWFLEYLYYMSMNTIGFQMVFLRANNEGERLYRNNSFIECDEYLSTYDAKADVCTSLAITLSEIEEVIF